MEFEKLSKVEKIKYWKEIQSDIHQSLLLCDGLISIDVVNEVNEYLDHNELGIALEGLTEVIIEQGIEISSEAKIQILNTFMKMNYHIDEKDQFYSYSEYLNEI